MFGEEHHSYALSPTNYASHKDYLYAFDLFNAGYYWESHVWWEELWHLAGRKGDVADLLKALIKLAAAGVKLKLNHHDPTRGHIERAIELIGPLLEHHGDGESFYGVNLKHLQHEMEDLLHGPEKLLNLKLYLDEV